MKYVYIALATFFTAGCLETSGQSRVINIAPGLGTINNIIDGDTTVTGDRIEPENTVYELECGGFYAMIRPLENNGYPLRIRIPEGCNERAILQPFVPSGGSDASRPFQILANADISGLYITGEDNLGGYPQRIFRIQAENVRLRIDNCWLDRDSQAAIRIDDNGSKVYITNSIISNIGLGTDPDNGRLIDDRGNSIDTLWIENNRVYNISSRFLRDGGDGVHNYVWVNHNTFWSSFQRGFDFAETINLTFTNNMVVNGAFDGDSFDAENIEGFVSLEAIDGQTMNISYNNFFYQQPFIDFLDEQTRIPTVLMDSVSLADNDPALTATNTTEVVSFTSEPPTAPLITFITNAYNDNLGANENFWDDENEVEYTFQYNTDAASYTGSSEGEEIGYRWQSGPLAIAAPELDFTFTVFPNPANGAVFIQLPEDRRAQSLTVYDLTGRQMHTQGLQGANRAELSVANYVPGLYIVEILDVQGGRATSRLLVN